ncbi:hypothetical protein [Microvirga yunnanensis]|uniref:hypothetical protein n=1 Tax=Microvirga yunnanensis TaxID=2953740 RepID=UPI0021CAC5F1|nr:MULTISPECIES: hypothetical protein [unclassified Microvirga]
MTVLLSLLSASVRGALLLLVLLGTANFATGLVFITGALQARADEAVRRAPSTTAFNDQGDPARGSRLSLRQR